MKKVCYILLVIVFVLSGCEKSDLLLPSNSLTLKNIRVELEAQDIVRKASFTAEGKIRNVILGSITTSDHDYVVRAYEYTSDHLLQCATEQTSWVPQCYVYLEYSNGVLDILNENPVEYNDNIITVLYLENDGRRVYEFSDSSYQQLLKVEYIRDVSTNPMPVLQETFEYENNNLIFIRAKRLDDITGQLEIVNETVYTYDDKRNPYQQGHNQSALVSYYNHMMYLHWNQFNLVYRSDNNVLTRTYTNFTSGFQNTISYTYEYNSMGYPIQRMHTISSGDIVKKYEYYE